MANNALTAKKREQLVANHVQQLAASDEEPPGNYCYRDGISGGSAASVLPLVEIPVVDISMLASDPSTSTQELEKLYSALSSFGCFMSINHGLKSSFLDKVQSVTKQFFSLPVEEKQRYAKEVSGREGYGNDIVFAENQVRDWNDRLVLVLKPQDQQQLRYWPQNPADFRETIREFTAKMETISKVVLKAMAKSLNLEEKCFLDKCGFAATMQARFNLYPPCLKPDQVLGLKPHSDASAITIVLQDKEVEGLQLLKNDTWSRVPIFPDALLINTGDQMEIMSNGVFKSPVHRVTINPERTRFSVAVFYGPHPDNDIEPVDGLVSETRPKLYKKVKNYVANYTQRYQQGKRLIEDMKI